MSIQLNKDICILPKAAGIMQITIIEKNPTKIQQNKQWTNKI